MKLQDVIFKAMAKKINWLEAEEITGICARKMPRPSHRTILSSTHDLVAIEG